MKPIFIIGIMLCIVFSIIGCSTSGVINTTTNTNINPDTTATTSIKKNVGLVYTEAPAVTSIDFGRWGTFGSLIINNYTAGSIINKSTTGIQPYYIINRIGEITEYKIIQTGSNAENKLITTSATESTAKFKLVYDPYPGIESIKIKSDLPTKSATFGDFIKINEYNNRTKELSISGLMQGQVRNLTVSYTFYEDTADIPIKKLLHAGDVSSVKISSDLATDDLKAISYNRDDNTLKISGFTPIAKRTAKITYLPDLLVTIRTDVNQKPTDTSYQVISPMIANWVNLSDKELIVAPESVVPVNVSLTTPKDFSFPNKWIFWIYFEPQSPKAVTTGVQIADPGYYNSFKVEMR